MNTPQHPVLFLYLTRWTHSPTEAAGYHQQRAPRYLSDESYFLCYTFIRLYFSAVHWKFGGFVTVYSRCSWPGYFCTGSVCEERGWISTRFHACYRKCDQTNVLQKWIIAVWFLLNFLSCHVRLLLLSWASSRIKPGRSLPVSNSNTQKSEETFFYFHFNMFW